MGDVKKLFGTDEDKETNGVWEDLTEDVRIKVARIGNTRYQKVLQRLMKPHRRAVRRGTVDDSIIEKCVIKAIAETVLLDWEGLEEDGKKIVYSQATAERLLNDFREFREQVTEIASEIESFKIEDEQEAEKN